MKNIRHTFAGLLFAVFLLTPTLAAAAAAKLGIGQIAVNPSVVAGVAANGNTPALQRVVESIDGQLIDAIQQTRKFEVIARDTLGLQAIEQEGAFASSGMVDADTAAELFSVHGVEYIVVTEINDFQDFTEAAAIGGTGKSMELRTIRIGFSLRVLDTTTGSLKESTSMQVEVNEIQEHMDSVATSTGRTSDKLYVQLSGKMAGKAANRVVDVIYPAKVLAITGNFATINRGEGAGVAVGDTLEVFAVGPDLIDPDTGENLGPQEIMVGQIEVMRVNPKTTTARITENFGIEIGSICRPPVAAAN